VLGERGADVVLTDRDPSGWPRSPPGCRAPAGPSSTTPRRPAWRSSPGLRTPRRYLTRLADRPMKPAAFAEAAITGVERGKALVVVPGRARAVALLQRLSPGAVARVGTKELARERELAR